MKLLKSSIIGLNILCLAGSTYAQDYAVVSADTYGHVQTYNQHVVNAEETDISKDYVTALALDGFRRLYEAGLDFVGKEPKTAIRQIESVKEMVQCAFNNALISNKDKYWSPFYVACVTQNKMITGNLNRDVVTTSAFPYDDTRYYKSYSSFSAFAADAVPGPLVLLYWTMARIGSVGLNLNEKTSKAFSDDVIKVITHIESRSNMGTLAYISEMESAFRRLQALIDSSAKSKTTKETGILNLMNLRLTEEGAAKLGQVAFEEANRAYASKMMEPDKAKELALFVLKHGMISSLINMQAGADLREYLDEVIQGYDEIYAKYTSLASKAPVRMAAKRNTAQKALSAYYVNDMFGFSNVKVEAAPLKDAFKIGRILGKDAKTAEYNTEKRADSRKKEAEARLNEFIKDTAHPSTYLAIEATPDEDKNKPLVIPATK